VVDFTDFNRIVSKIVMNDKWKFFRITEESQNFAVVVKELLLAWDFATTKSFFHVFLHFIITWASNFNC
jgi:hypothetical protein